MKKRDEAKGGSPGGRITTDHRLETKAHAVDRELERSHMKKRDETAKESLLKKIRTGLRLKTKAPGVIRDRTRYTRKSKYPADETLEQ